MATFLTALVVALAVGAAIYVMIADKKAGKHSCGGNCAQCKGCHH